MKLIYLLVFCVQSLLIITHLPIAQANISGVMGPNINPNDRSIQFRSAVTLADDSSQQDNWAYRLHYQHAFNDTFRARIVMQYRDRNNFEYDFFRTELLFNFKKASANDNWSSALRFDLRTRRGSRPEEFAVNWGNQWDLNDGYRMRATIILGKQIGGSRQLNGITVQTRASFSRKLENGLRVGMQMLNQHGEAGHFSSFDEQGLYLGPAVSGSFGDFKYEFRYLKGLSSAVRDHNVFFRVTRSL
ncbi:hypothetical protein [Glaciecola sp. SC05]|uniref:hypothetical protein n=1 Tax=Glaciecola sp. SC05 TaxID=1987355 RepID=UPI0035287EBD